MNGIQQQRLLLLFNLFPEQCYRDEYYRIIKTKSSLNIHSFIWHRNYSTLSALFASSGSRTSTQSSPNSGFGSSVLDDNLATKPVQPKKRFTNILSRVQTSPYVQLREEDSHYNQFFVFNYIFGHLVFTYHHLRLEKPSGYINRNPKIAFRVSQLSLNPLSLAWSVAIDLNSEQEASEFKLYLGSRPNSYQICPSWDRYMGILATRNSIQS